MAAKKPSFEEALKRLETLTEQIEGGKVGLEESIAKYEEGMKLVRYCRSVLDKAEHKIERLQFEADGASQVGDSSPAPAGGGESQSPTS